MNRLERIERDMEKAQRRIAEWQAKFKELDGQRTEAENTEIVAAIRAMRMTNSELGAFLKTGTLPATLADKAAIAPARFEKRPEPKAAEPVKAVDSKPNPAIPAAAAPTNTITKESEGKSNES
jgi:hypothetical protein